MGKRFLVLILCLSMILPVNAIQAFATNEDEAVEEISTSIVPECECDNGSEDLAAHSDSQCSLKAYCIETANNKTADELYAMWNEFPANGQAFILTYLSWGQQEKLEQLNVLLNGSGTEESSVENTASDGMKVTVSGNLPENAGVEIESETDTELRELFDNPEYWYDIKLTKEGNLCQPDEQVTVQLNIEVPEDEGVLIYHILEDEETIKSALEKGTAQLVEKEEVISAFPEEATAVLNAVQIENSICIEILSTENGRVEKGSDYLRFDVDSFSDFIIYTVDFHYNDNVYSIPGGSGILLSELFERLGIEKDILDVTDVVFTDESLISIEKEDADWRLTSLRPFLTEEFLTIIFSDRVVIELRVTDLAVQSTNNEVKVSSSGLEKTYQLFGCLYPSVQSQYTSWAGAAGYKVTLRMYESDGAHVGDARMTEAFTDSVQFSIWGDYAYHIYDSDYCKVKNYSDSYNNVLFDSISWTTNTRYVYIRRYPLLMYSNTTYCNVKRQSVLTTDIQNRTVKVYANGTYVGENTVAFPYRTSMAASDLTVSNVRSPYVAGLTKVSIENGYYRVDLYSQNKATASVGTGVSETSGSGTYKYGTEVTFGATVRDGYTWDGWYNGATKVSSSQTYKFIIGTSDVNYTAKATPNRNTATANIGTGIASTTGSGTYGFESNVPFTATVKPGYTWDGWYNSTGTKVSGSTSYTFTMPNSAVTYTAKATPNTYYVKFDSNTGTGTMSNQTFTYDKAQNLTANAFSKAGHTFDGWNTASDGSGKPFGDKASVSNLTATNGATITLFAQWKINKHIATANKETGVKEVTGSGTYDYGTDVTFKATLKDGYEFAGWYDASGNKVSDSAEYTFAMPDNDVTYTAKAKAAEVKYTVKHMIKDYGEDEYYQYKESVEMTGHVDDETVAKAIKILGYTVIEPIAQKKITADGKTVVEIYYDENVINITYNSNNNNYGTVDPTQETTGATTSSLIGSVPTAQKGYKFVGWYKDKACTNAVNADWVIKDTNRLIPQKVDGLNEETDYYAKFEPIKSTIIVKMFVDGEMADKTKLFTGKVNYSVHSGTDDVSVPYSLKDGAVSETITVDAGKQVWLTDLLTDEKYTLDKVELNGTVINNNDVQNFVEGEENVFCIYYSSKDVPATGIDEGSNGLMVMLLTVAIFFVGFLFFGKRYRRNEV